MEYNFCKLWSVQFWGFFKFKNFCMYAEDEESQAAYYKRLGAIHINEKGKIIEEPSQLLLDTLIEENRAALEMIKNQVIVFLFTKYEFMIKDAIKCLLCEQPEKILRLTAEYPEYQESLGFSLKEFVKCRSKEEYVAVLSERLSTHCLSGRPSTVMKRLRCLLKFKDIDADTLDDLLEKRNNIVHESKVYELSLEDLERYYDTVESLLMTLALALKRNHIAVADNTGLLDEEEF